MRNGKVRQLVGISALLLIGLLLGRQVNSFFTIEFHPKQLPSVVQAKAPEAFSTPPFSGKIAAIVIDHELLRDELYRRAVDSLADAVEVRTGTRPAIDGSLSGYSHAAVIAVGRAAGETSPARSSVAPSSPEAFAVHSYSRNGATTLIVQGGSRLGDVYGTYWLADQLLAGTSEEEIFSLHRTVVPALQHRFVDMGAVGIVPDAAWGDDYLHNTRAFHHVVLAAPPYVDEAAFSRAFSEFKEYLQRMIAYGCNGIVFDGFLEFVNFDLVGDGRQIYGAESEFRRRHAVLREKFGQLFNYAHSLGVKVVLKTDMLALTPPLEHYFRTTLGGLDASEPRLWEVYGLGLRELFQVFPFLDGLMVRTGEAGGVYNVAGWDYYSRLGVRDDKSLKMMLHELLAAAEEQGARIYFRNWSVGIGGIGDMHVNPHTYQRVLGRFDSPRLVVSSKYCRGDFFSYLPYNPTLQTGKHARMVEFQARREFEGFGVLPNYLAMTHQSALLALRRANPNINGLWLWTQSGGPLRAGPMALYPFHGFWRMIDANVYATARLAWDPNADLERLTTTWVRKNFGDDPETVARLTEMLLLSHQAVEKGLYIGNSARSRIVAFGLEPPPTPWMWDMVSGSNSALSVVYLSTKEQLREAIDEGFEAVQLVRRMQALVRDVPLARAEARQLHKQLMEALDYEENLFDTLAWYRRALLSYYHWLDKGEADTFGDWRWNLAVFADKKQRHVELYGANPDFPAYNFMPAEVGMAHAKRSESMALIARVITLLALVMLFSGSRPINGRLSGLPGGVGLKALWLAMTDPWKDHPHDAKTSSDWVAAALPFPLFMLGVFTFCSFLSTELPLWIGLFAAFALVPLCWVIAAERPSSLRLLASVSGSLLCLTILFMAVVSIRGHGYFWFQFWTNPTYRIILSALLFACTSWSCWVLLAGLCRTCRNSLSAAWGILLTSLGASLVGGFSFFAVTGLETRLTALNNEMAILPLCLSKVLGITTHLNISDHLPNHAILAGLALLVAGPVLTALSRLRRARSRSLPVKGHAGLELSEFSESTSDL